MLAWSWSWQDLLAAEDKGHSLCRGVLLQKGFGLGVLQISQTEQVAQHGSGTLAIRHNKYWALIIL